MNDRATRVTRGWVVGVFATGLAALSHAIAGGGTPSALALVVGVVFGGMLGTFALSARPSLPRLVVAVGGSQLAFHLAFSTLGAAAPVAGEHLHGAMTMSPELPHAHAASPAMWISHALAGLVTLALLRGAERAAWRVLAELARLVVAPLQRSLPLPVAVPRARTPIVPLAPASLSSRLLDPAVSRRGPPLSVAF